jgi:hypothetical protein
MPPNKTTEGKGRADAEPHALIDARSWRPGERLVFEPYTSEAHAETFAWITRHCIVARRRHGPRPLRRFGNFAASGVGRPCCII